MSSVFFDRFDVGERVQFGAFCAIYRVKDRVTGQILALKIEKMESSYTILKYEYELTKQLQDIPNIVCVYDYFENKTDKGFTMELLSNNLSDIRHLRRNPPSLSMLTYITKECLLSLKEVHAKNVLHHDIKPSNFLIRFENDDYRVVLIDFGLSVSLNEPESISKFRYNLEQNPRYHSIDCYGNKNWTQREDLVSLIYTISDFWKDSLPWDGRMSARLIYEEKVKHSLESLLPPELSFLVTDLDKGTEYLYNEAEKLLQTMLRNIKEEIKYLTDPLDPGYKRKVADIVVEPETKKKFKNQHSA